METNKLIDGYPKVASSIALALGIYLSIQMYEIRAEVSANSAKIDALAVQMLGLQSSVDMVRENSAKIDALATQMSDLRLSMSELRSSMDMLIASQLSRSTSETTATPDGG